jgi:hypothetical protein
MLSWAFVSVNVESIGAEKIPIPRLFLPVVVVTCWGVPAISKMPIPRLFLPLGVVTRCILINVPAISKMDMTRGLQK